MVSGMSLSLSDLPVQKKLPREIHMSEEQVSSAKSQIQQLIQKGAIQETTFDPKVDFLSNVFLTPKPDGSFRMILNLKQFNKYVEYVHFKMESLQNILDLVVPSCFQAVLDLTNAYLTVPMGRRYIHYLKFSFQGKVYVYLVLPFGISSAPRKFTKLLKPIIAHLRRQGIFIVIYIDDMWICASSYQACLRSVLIAAELLVRVGFLLNKKKSAPVPSTTAIALGYCIDSFAMVISLPLKKEQDVLFHCSQLLHMSYPKICYVARVIGKLVSCFLVLPLGCAHYRSLERVKVSTLQSAFSNYDAVCQLSSHACEDLHWWLINLPAAAAPIDHGPISLEIFSDACFAGWGTYFPPSVTHGFFDVIERAESINTKETLAIWYSLLSFLPHLQNQHVLVHSDSAMAISYVSKLGGMDHLGWDQIARDIWKLAQDNNFWLLVSFVPGQENVEADTESCARNPFLEYTLPKDAFIAITHVCGFPQIDLFASRLNAQLPLYVSWLPDPYCFSVDAFKLSWLDWFAFIFPPFILVSRILKKIILDRMTVIMVVPAWPTQPWFLQFLDLLIAPPVLLRPEHMPYIPFPIKRSQQDGTATLKYHLLAAKLSGDITKTLDFQMVLLNCSPTQLGRIQRDHITQDSRNGFIFAIDKKLLCVRLL